MKRPLIALGLVSALTGLTGLTGCSGGDTTAVTKPAAKTSATTAVTKPEFVANTQDTPGTLENFVGAHADVSNTTCTATKVGWVAKGAVKNPTEKAAKYRIYVSILDGDATLGIAQTDVKRVPEGATSEWTAAADTTGENLRCILRVERAAA